MKTSLASSVAQKGRQPRTAAVPASEEPRPGSLALCAGRRRTCVGRLLLTCLVIAGLLAGDAVAFAPPARAGSRVANGILTLAGTDVDALVWKTNFHQHMSDRLTGMVGVVYGALLKQMYEENPLLDPVVANQRLGEFKQAFADLYGALPNRGDWRGSPVRMLDLLMLTAQEEAGGVSVRMFQPVYDSLIDGLMTSALDDALKATGTIYSSDNYALLIDAEGLLLDQWRNAALDNPYLEAASNALAATALNANIGDSASTIVAKNPGIGIPPMILESLEETGEIQTSLAELNQAATDIFVEVNLGLLDLSQTIRAIDTKQAKILEYMKNADERAKQEAVAKAKAAEHKSKVDAANAGIYIVSTLAGLIDPKTGKQIATIGKAAVSIYDAADKWLESVAKLTATGATLSTVVFTGNVLGAVMSVVSLFEDAGPSPEQQILQQVRALRQQIADLADQMNDRFDRIDKQLNVVYTEMMGAFQAVNLELWKLEGTLKEIQEQLVRIESTLDRMEKETYTYFTTVEREPLLEAINGGLGYSERTGTVMLYTPDYAGYENVFQTWATIHAFNPLNAGPQTRNYSDAGVAVELDRFPLDVNINYLNGWLAARNLPLLSSSRLPGMSTWALAALSYARLARENALYAQQINPARMQAVVQVGDDLRAAIRRIGLQPDESGWAPNHALFDFLVSDYLTKTHNLDAAMAQNKTTWINDAVNSSLVVDRPGTTFDLFGGANQALTWTAPALNTMTYGSTMASPLKTPTNLRQKVSPLTLLANAEYFHRGTLAVNWGADWVDKEWHDCVEGGYDEWGHLWVWVDVKFNGVTIARQQYTEPEEEVVTRCDGTSKLAKQVVFSCWENASPPLRTTFEIQSTAGSVPNPGAAASTVNAALAAVNSRLVELQAQFLADQDLKFQAGSLYGPAKALDGSKRIAVAFTSVGFDRDIAMDDFLRSLLFGNQGLMDYDLTRLYLAGVAGATAAGTQAAPLLQDPRIALIQATQDRITAFDERVDEYLTKLADGTWQDENAMVEDTLLMAGVARLMVNDAAAPVAHNDSASGLANTPLVLATATLLANDTDANGDTLVITVVGSSTPTGATVHLATGQITYTPPAGFTGQGGFTYTISDGRGGTSAANVTVAIQAGGGTYRVFAPLVER